jgi:hypothetical protein
MYTSFQILSNSLFTSLLIIWRYTVWLLNADISVGIAKGYGLDGRGSISGRGKKFFFTPQRPDWLWDPPSLLYNWYRGHVPQGYSGLMMKLTTNLHLVPRSRMVELYLHSPIYLHSTVLQLYLYWQRRKINLIHPPSYIIHIFVL